MTFGRFPDNRSSDGESEPANAYLMDLGEEASARRLMGDAGPPSTGGADEEQGPEQGVFGASEPLPGRGVAANAAPNTPLVVETCFTVGKKLGVAIPVMDAVLELAGGHRDSPLADMANIPEKIMIATAADCLVDGRSLPAMTVSRVMQWWRRSRVLAPPEEIGLPGTSGQPSKTAASNEGEKPPPTPAKKKLSGILRQKDDTEYTELSEDVLIAMRMVYKDRCGRHPPEKERPSDDQLTALAACLTSGKTPVVDFSVWGSYSERTVKERSFTAQVWINNQLVTRQLTGPSDFAAWTKCWRVYRAAMIMCKAAHPSTLDCYEESLQELMLMYPHAWGLIMQADDILRNERWSRIRTGHRMEPPRGLDKAMPWDAVILEGSYGNGGPMAHWWLQRVTHPASLDKGNATKFLRMMDGTPAAGSGSMEEWQPQKWKTNGKGKHPEMMAIEDGSPDPYGGWQPGNPGPKKPPSKGR